MKEWPGLSDGSLQPLAPKKQGSSRKKQGSGRPKRRPSANAEQAMMEVREAFAPIFKYVVVSILVIILVTTAAMIALAFWGFSTIEKGFLVRLIQISHGMMLGAACVFFGVVLSWLGITASFALGAESEFGPKGRFTLQSTSPGLVLIVAGAVLIGVSLYKEVNYQEIQEAPGVSIQPASPPESHADGAPP